MAGNACSFAYSRLFAHQIGANLQMQRMRDACPNSSSADNLSDEERLRNAEFKNIRLLPEIHFYMVSWSSCGNMLKIIVSHEKFSNAKTIYDKYSPIFKHYRNGRHTFEHFHDRLPGQKDERNVIEITEGGAKRKVFLGIKNKCTIYEHSDQKWDIGPKSLEQLNQAVVEIVEEVHRIVNESDLKFLS